MWTIVGPRASETLHERHPYSDNHRFRYLGDDSVLAEPPTIEVAIVGEEGPPDNDNLCYFGVVQGFFTSSSRPDCRLLRLFPSKFSSPIMFTLAHIHPRRCFPQCLSYAPPAFETSCSFQF